MNGPAHLREAKRLVEQAHHYSYGDGADPATGAALAAEALAHAQIAAVSLNVIVHLKNFDLVGPHREDWLSALGEPTTPYSQRNTAQQEDEGEDA